jgi:hypothetical protein
MRPKLQERSARTRVLPRLERFEPMAPLALAKVRELLAKDAVLVRASRDQVQLVRHGVTATIDTWGRVVWAVG